MLFWILGIVHMGLLFLVAGPVAAMIGGGYTTVIFIIAHFIGRLESSPINVESQD